MWASEFSLFQTKVYQARSVRCESAWSAAQPSLVPDVSSPLSAHLRGLCTRRDEVGNDVRLHVSTVAEWRQFGGGELVGLVHGRLLLPRCGVDALSAEDVQEAEAGDRTVPDLPAHLQGSWRTASERDGSRCKCHPIVCEEAPASTQLR